MGSPHRSWGVRQQLLVNVTPAVRRSGRSVRPPPKRVEVRRGAAAGPGEKLRKLSLHRLCVRTERVRRRQCVPYGLCVRTEGRTCDQDAPPARGARRSRQGAARAHFASRTVPRPDVGGRLAPAAAYQSSTTLPEAPLRITSKPRWKSSMGKRWVITGREVEPALQHRDHLVPGLEHLPAVDALQHEALEDHLAPVDGLLARHDAEQRHPAAVVHRRRAAGGRRARCRSSRGRRRSPRSCRGRFITSRELLAARRSPPAWRPASAPARAGSRSRR